MPPVVPFSSEWWLERLSARLDERGKDISIGRDGTYRRVLSMKTLDDYYLGRHPLAFASFKFRETFGGLFDAWADNFCRLVVDAPKERLKVQGFRMGGQTDTDADAWRIWQWNGMDAQFPRVQLESLKKGDAALIVSPFRAEWPREDVPLITVEDPLQVVVDVDPGTRRRRAALKRWRDDDGRWLATLYLPDRIEKWQEAKPGAIATALVTLTGGTIRQWQRREVRGESWPLPNPLGVVPVVPMPNMPDIYGRGEAEHKAVVPIQDAINKLCADMLVASEFAAYRQRWAINVEQPVDPKTGQPKPLELGVNRLVQFPPPDPEEYPDASHAPKPELGEFEATDLRPYIGAIEAYIQHAASITKTPPHYLLGQSGTFPSGESLHATETGLVAKVYDRMIDSGEACEEVQRLCFRALGDPRGEVADIETIWKDPESRTEAEHVDALLKLKSLGVPDEQLWEDAGYTPTQIARFKRMRAAQALVAPALPSPTAPVSAINVTPPAGPNALRG